jgi:phospholipid/cholesterol/gamma-HCH transport system substrate-binding protein
METRANYALIGLFSLAVIFGAFGFAYWFSGASHQQIRKQFIVHFVGSVSGLNNGASVLFNGLKVGEVTELGLMREDPNRVYANISVDARTPVKTDTQARLETGTLTGVAWVALLGGSPNAEPLADKGVIDAVPSQFQDLILTAQKLSSKAEVFLDRVNKLLDDNSATLTTSMTNIQTLTGALAESSASFKDAMASIEPSKVRSILDNADQSMAKVNALLGKGEGKAMISDISEAARSIKKLSDNLSKFATSGLKQYEGLAVDGRKTLQDVDATVRQLKSDPSSIIFGAKPALPVYNGK